MHMDGTVGQAERAGTYVRIWGCFGHVMARRHRIPCLGAGHIGIEARKSFPGTRMGE